MKRVTALGVPLAIVLAVVMSGSALAAATHDVSIANFAFTPASTKAKLGDTVRWTNNQAGVTHTSTSDGVNDGSGFSGIGLWASGNIAPNGTFSFTFNFAGTYPYHCSIHNFMTGTVKVPMKAKPTSGGVGTNFTITWASAVPGGTLVFDVQRMNPGGSFKPWQTGVTTMSAKFKPNAPGTYQFRALLRDSSSGAKSKFSPVVKITVS